VLEDIKLYEKHLAIATKAHAGQMRRDGVTPYINHPIAVASMLASLGYAGIYQHVALLHDVVEDTEITDSDLRQCGVSAITRECVAILTHPDGANYHQYLAEVKPNQIARVVKVADICCNLMDGPTEFQVIKYIGALKFLLSPD
jgi:(p)ppGpp synthase/HD superfamily hydrolase